MARWRNPLPATISGVGYLMLPEPAARTAAHPFDQKRWMSSRSVFVPLAFRSIPCILCQRGLKNLSPGCRKSLLSEVEMHEILCAHSVVEDVSRFLLKGLAVAEALREM